jgi:hypothetical protein
VICVRLMTTMQAIKKASQAPITQRADKLTTHPR